MQITKFLKEVKRELLETTFPSRSTTILFTSFVIGFTIMMSIYLAALDLGLGELVIRMITSFK
jgi:preprotein translocase SecE subunit